MSEITDSDFINFFNIQMKYTKEQLISLLRSIQAITNNRYHFTNDIDCFTVKCPIKNCPFELKIIQTETNTQFQFINSNHTNHNDKNTTISSDFGEANNALLQMILTQKKPRKQKKQQQVTDADEKKKPKHLKLNTDEKKGGKSNKTTIKILNEKKIQDETKPIEIVSSKKLNQILFDNKIQTKENIEDSIDIFKTDSLEEKKEAEAKPAESKKPSGRAWLGRRS